jgi:hypothetical protein
LWANLPGVVFRYHTRPRGIALHAGSSLRGRYPDKLETGPLGAVNPREPLETAAYAYEAGVQFQSLSESWADYWSIYAKDYGGFHSDVWHMCMGSVCPPTKIETDPLHLVGNRSRD